MEFKDITNFFNRNKKELISDKPVTADTFMVKVEGLIDDAKIITSFKGSYVEIPHDFEIISPVISDNTDTPDTSFDSLKKNRYLDPQFFGLKLSPVVVIGRNENGYALKSIISLGGSKDGSEDGSILFTVPKKIVEGFGFNPSNFTFSKQEN